MSDILWVYNATSEVWEVCKENMSTPNEHFDEAMSREYYSQLFSSRPSSAASRDINTLPGVTPDQAQSWDPQASFGTSGAPYNNPVVIPPVSQPSFSDLMRELGHEQSVALCVFKTHDHRSTEMIFPGIRQLVAPHMCAGKWLTLSSMSKLDINRKHDRSVSSAKHVSFSSKR